MLSSSVRRQEPDDLPAGGVLEEPVDGAADTLHDVTNAADLFEQGFPLQEPLVFDFDAKQTARLQ